MNCLLIAAVPVLAAFGLVAGTAVAQDVASSGYVHTNGTYVQPYYRTAPDDSVYNNYSTYPNFNPYSGRIGTHHYPPSPTYFTPRPIQMRYGNSALFAAAIAVAQSNAREEARVEAEQQYREQFERQQRYWEQRQAELANKQMQHQTSPPAPLYYRKSDDFLRAPVASSAPAAPAATVAETPAVQPPPSQDQQPYQGSGDSRASLIIIRPVRRHVPDRSVLEAKRNFVRSIWPGVRKNYPKEVGDALVTAANNPTWSPQDVRGLWVKIQDHFRAERAK